MLFHCLAGFLSKTEKRMFVQEYSLCNRTAFDKCVIVLAKFHPFLENEDHRNPYLEDKLTQDPTTSDFFLLVWPRGFHKPNAENDQRMHHKEGKIDFQLYACT